MGSNDRTIGRAVRIKTYQALVELSPDTTSYVKSSFGGLYAIAVVNSFVILPVGSERVVAVVTALDMAEDAEASMQNRQMLVIAKPRRTMWVSMIGTITQTVDQKKHFEYGVKRYPELDNPVWFASDEDLDVIFDKQQQGESQRITIGRSPIFTDYDVTIDADKFFGKHAAILGNTGSGKSCTVTALIKAVLDRNMPSAHFIILDTNNEYEQAFTKVNPGNTNNRTPIYNRLVLRNDGDTPKGLYVPHWFMNGADYQAFFRPGEGAQAPLLFKAVRSARTQTSPDAGIRDTLDQIQLDTDGLDALLVDPPRGAAAFYHKRNVRDLASGTLAFLETRSTEMIPQGIDRYIGKLKEIMDSIIGDGALMADDGDLLRRAIRRIREHLGADRRGLQSESLIGIDTPRYFDFDEFVSTVFEAELSRESQRDPRLRSYIGTLQLRLEQAREDPRYAFLFRIKPFENALASFLRLLLGLDPARNFESAKPPWANSYHDQYAQANAAHQITILDLSELASEVLENVTALFGRLVLDFMQKIPERATMPVVLVLEEAHRYIPENARFERQARAREVFEKIAKEGRKFGLGLLVASQRPSELSRTVLAQCNSFIVHRIQNPDDQEYFRSVISGINRELLDQLPALPQQHAIVMGDCVTLPLQVRINSVDPRPRSLDPEFMKVWRDPGAPAPDVEAIARKWEARE
jgi:uncharacterized protein